MPQRRNPVAASPLLRKGGAHVKSKSAERKKVRDALRKEVESVLSRRKSYDAAFQ